MSKHAFISLGEDGVLRATTQGATATFPASCYPNPVKAMRAALIWADNIGAESFEYHIQPLDYEYECFGDTLDKADSLGFDSEAECTKMEAADPNRMDDCAIGDVLEEMAVEYIRNMGYTVTNYDE